MERIPLKDLTCEELVGLVDRLFDRLADSERRNAELLNRLEKQAERIDEQSRRIEELEKRHPTVRLDESYSLKAEEGGQAKASGKKRKQKSKRRGRISTAEKLAEATSQEVVWPPDCRREDCQWKYARPV